MLPPSGIQFPLLAEAGREAAGGCRGVERPSVLRIAAPELSFDCAVVFGALVGVAGMGYFLPQRKYVVGVRTRAISWNPKRTKTATTNAKHQP